MRKVLILISALVIGFTAFSQSPTPHATLEKIFPSTVLGGKLIGEVEGLTINIEGTAFSNALAHYAKGNLTIDISIIDYVNAQDMVEASAFDLNKDLDYTSENSFAKTFMLDGNKGYVMGDKSANTTIMMIAWNDRFVLTINMVGKVSEEYIKSIYKELDLSVLD